MRSPYRFAIVGGGLAATSMLCQFVEKALRWERAGKLNPSVIDVTLFEKTGEFGPGFPHNHRYLMPFHITNMCAADMGVYAERPGDFQVWVDANRKQLQERFAAYPAGLFGSAAGHGPCRHYPRAFMGAYLQARFDQAVAVARRHGMAVKLCPCHEITDIKPAGDAVRLAVNHIPCGGQPDRLADAVLLATGHWFSDSRQPNYFDSPWPAQQLLEQIPLGAELAVIGTSLSAIETVLTLTSDGRFVGDAGDSLTYIPSKKPRRITLYSRNGLLPKVRGKVGSYENQFLTPAALKNMHGSNDGRQTLAATFELLNAELEAIYGRPIDWREEVLEPSGCPADHLRRSLKKAKLGDDAQRTVFWQTVLHQTFPSLRQWYLTLADQDRERFDRDYTSAFFTHAATQPRINAAKLFALLNAGFVRVVRLGRRYRFYKDAGHGRYCFDYLDQNGQRKTDTYRYVINARGQSTSLTTDPSELTQNLIAFSRAQGSRKPAERAAASGQRKAKDPKAESGVDRHGTVRIDPRTHRVVLPDFGPRSAVYAVGAMTRRQIIDASMAHGISRSTAAVADDLLRILSSRRRK